MQITYETASGRKVINMPPVDRSGAEPAPHGAGSFHDPEHHQQLMDRVEALLRQA
jgi:hypothetical protein